MALLERVRESSYGDHKIDIRVGINTGNVVAGNVGGGGRENYTVHGDAVNTAARLEAMNKEFGTRVLVSGSTAERLSGFHLHRVGETSVRGQRATVELFALQDPPG